MTAVAVAPDDPARWLIGTAAGGLWLTEDGGTTFVPTSDAQPSLAIGAVTFCPSDATRVYAGTGEANFSADAYGGEGLLTSDDGGSSWRLLDSASATGAFAGATTSDIKVDRDDCGVLIVATASNVVGCRNGLDHQPASPVTGIFRSGDGGENWSRTLENAEVTDIEVAPDNFARQYAGVANAEPRCPTTTPGGLYRSMDGGQSWDPVVGPWSGARVGRIELAIAPNAPGVLYVSIEDASVEDGLRTAASGSLLGLFRTTNAWNATPDWEQINTDPTDPPSDLAGYCAPACWYRHDLIVDPADADVLYAGGLALWKRGGSGWSNISGGASGIQVNQHALAWARDRLIVGNDGGVWSTADAGATWTNHNESLAITQFNAGSVSPDGGELVLGGSQGNGIEKWLGCEDDWAVISGSHSSYGGYSSISTANPRQHWAVSEQELALYRTRDGATFERVDEGIDKQGVAFIAPIAECPSDPDVFLAGTDNLWRTKRFFSDAAPQWARLRPEMRVSVSAIAFSPADPQCRTYAFGTKDGRILFTNDDAASWKHLALHTPPGEADPDPVPDRAVTDLAFHPADSNVLYATFSGFKDSTPGRPGHVFRTTRALGISPMWENVSPSSVDIPHNAVVVDPADGQVIYVGADLGLWGTTDAGKTWTQMGVGEDLPNAPVVDLAIDPTSRRVFAFTHGRGAFVLSSPDEVACDDHRVCTDDACEGVAGCMHRPRGCGDADVCTDDLCSEPMGCFNPITCDPASGCPAGGLRCADRDECTNDRCDEAGTCVHEPVTCDDGRSCTADTCDPDIGCRNVWPDLCVVIGGLSANACDVVPPGVGHLIEAAKDLVERGQRAKSDKRLSRRINRALGRLQKASRRLRSVCRGKALEAGKISLPCCEVLGDGIERRRRALICVLHEIKTIGRPTTHCVLVPAGSSSPPPHTSTTRGG